MHLSMILLADYASADASGKLNILGAFTQLNAPQFPVKHALMHLVMKFQPALGEYGDKRTLRVIVVSEDGEELYQLSGEMEIPEAKGGEFPELNAIIGFRDLVFPRPGRYEFRVFVDKEQKEALPLTVTQVNKSQPEK